MRGNFYTLQKIVMNYNSKFNGIDNAELIELRIIAGSTGQLFTFADQAQLTGMKVMGIEAYNANDFPVSPFSGYVLPDEDLFSDAFLQLYQSQHFADDSMQPNGSGGSWKYGLNNYPLISLHRTINSNGDTYVRDFPLFSGNIVQWLKSNIFIAPVPTISANTAFMFNIYYSSYQQSVR